MTLFCTAKEFSDLCFDLEGKAEQISLQAKGGSMFPFIRSGDWVDIQLLKQKKELIGKGEIILFRKDGYLCLHRVLQKRKQAVLAKGDMSFGHDGIIGADNILGRVVSIQRGRQRINLGALTNRYIAVIAADLSLFLQYPVLFARKIFSFAAAGFYRIQGFKAYRVIVKKIFNDQVVVRCAEQKDQEQLRDLYLMAGKDIREGLARTKARGFWLVAERRQRIAGGLTVTRSDLDPLIWLIFGLEVKPIFRGLGIGSKIVKEAILKAGKSGARRIELCVNKKAYPAVSLYRKLGFESIDTLPPGLNLSSDELYLSYKIDD
jgi:ribosomal protein S18 acetylase RimI-like enzyme